MIPGVETVEKPHKRSERIQILINPRSKERLSKICGPNNSKMTYSEAIRLALGSYYIACEAQKMHNKLNVKLNGKTYDCTKLLMP